MESGKQDTREPQSLEDFLQNDWDWEMLKQLGFDGLSEVGAKNIAHCHYLIKNNHPSREALERVISNTMIDELDRLIEEWRKE